MLREAPKTVVAKGFTEALSAAGNVVADQVVRRCPVKKEDTGGLLERGELREAVMVAVQLDSQFRGGVANIGFMNKATASVAMWVEWGHRMVVPGGYYFDDRGRKRQGTHVRDVPAHPFMRPAADESGDRAIDAFAQSISRTVRENFPQGATP